MIRSVKHQVGLLKTFTIHLHDISHGGDAVGELDGKTIFVPLGIPGETVCVTITDDHPRYANARLVEVLEPSPLRVAPSCPHFGRCGGCQWQHIAYPYQLELKQRIVSSQLQRIGKLPNVRVQPVIGMENPWAYRNNVQYALDASGQLGFRALRSHDIVPISECWIAHPLLEDLAAAFDLECAGLTGLTLRVGAATGEQLVIFEGDSVPDIEVDFPVSCVYQSPEGKVTVLAGDSCYHEQLNQRLWQVSGPSFFQVNTSQAERLLRTVSERLLDKNIDTLIDAYCGVGTFALSLASRAKRVIGIEESPWAIYDAEANRLANEDVTFQVGATEELLPDGINADCTVILDPPRAGCKPEVLQTLAVSGSKQVIYVSCDPATLARDLALLARYGYQIGDVQPIDMFPQTNHIECVVSVKR
ncbi:MAG: class I SAM-dependent RNA methyltransferase [Lysobacterales bacterium]|nr:MAG: class I SAM-dependent RNA methyltransferase [Xanthomonadales bacterium]